MERRQFLHLALSLSVGSGAVFLSGCGGGKSTTLLGGGGISHPPIPVTGEGRVLFPAGFPLAPSTLRLLTPQPTPLKADSSFAFHAPGSDAALLILADSADRPIMLGFSGSAATNGIAEVSPTQTAVALLFYALGAFTLPPDAQQQVRGLLTQNDQVLKLAQQISTLLVQKPFAVADSEPALFGAVAALRDAFLAGASGPARSARLPGSSRSRQEPAATQIQVSPEDAISGLRASSNAEGLGLVVSNDRRRNALMYIYQTAYTDENGARHTDVNHKQAEGDILFATSGLAGVAGSLIDYANGTNVYNAVLSKAYSLDLYPTGAARAEYRIDLISNGNGNDAQNIENDNPFYKTNYVKICLLTFVKDLLLPAIASIAGLQSSLRLDIAAGTGQAGTDLLAAMDDVAVILSGVVDTTVAISQSSARSLLVGVMKALANNGTLRQRFVEWMVNFLVQHGLSTETAGLLNGLGSALNGVTIIVDKLLGGFDLGLVLSDWATSDSYIRFEAKVIQPKVRVKPAAAELDAGDSLTLTASVPAVNDPTVTFHWTVLTGKGTLQNPVSGLTGTTLDSASPDVTYRSDSSSPENAQDQVLVEAFLGGVNNPSRTSIGKAIATITTSGPNLVLNGKFNDGLANWRTVAVRGGSFSGFPKFFISPPSQNCIRPGNPACGIDVPGGAEGYIEQTITLPNRELTLSFATWVNLDGTTGTVRIVADGVESVLDTFEPKSIESGFGCSGTSFVTKTYDLGGFQGKTILLRLSGTSGSANGTIINYDDVSIR